MSDYEQITNWIKESDYKIKTSMENLADMILLCFDSPDNYGEYDPKTGCGGYGNEYSFEECKRYVEECGGFTEFDYLA